MDSILFNTLYSSAACKFTDAADIVALGELTGSWPINRQPSRLMLLYIFVLAQVSAGTVILDDTSIFAIVSRINTLKYK